MKTFSVRGEDSLSASSAAASTSDAPSQRHSGVSTGGSVAHASPVTIGRELPSFAGNSDKAAASRGSILGAEEGVTHSGGSEVVTNPSELRAVRFQIILFVHHMTEYSSNLMNTLIDDYGL